MVLFHQDKGSAVDSDRDLLTDAQWERIECLLPGRVGHVGGTAPDNRLFLEAVLSVLRTGSPWRDLNQARFGLWKSVYNRFNRWGKGNVWERVFAALAEDPDCEYVMLDSTVIRAHQHAAGAKKTMHSIRHWAVVEVVFPQKSMRLWTPLASPSALS
jgi:transposase